MKEIINETDSCLKSLFCCEQKKDRFILYLAEQYQENMQFCLPG